MWNGTMFVDLDWPLNASSLLSASAELLVYVHVLTAGVACKSTVGLWRPSLGDKHAVNDARSDTVHPVFLLDPDDPGRELENRGT